MHVSKILIVDDILIRRSLSRTLQTDRVVLYQAGGEASARLVLSKVDLVITSLELQEGCGLSLVASATRQRIPAILLSEDLVRLTSPEVNCVCAMGRVVAMDKPFQVTRLRDEVSRLLRRQEVCYAY